MTKTKECVDKLIELPAKVKRPILPKVRKDKDVTKLTYILKDEETNRSPVKPGYTPLMLAVMKGNKDKTTVLIENNASMDTEVKSMHYLTPLLLAINNKVVGMIELLLVKGANINYKGKRGGWTPLLYAIMIQEESIVKLLLKHGANLSVEARTNLSEDMLENTALTRELNRIKNILSALRTQYQYEDCAAMNLSPLMLAVLRGSESIVNTIFDNMSDKRQICRKDTISPLTLAVLTKSHKIAKLLINRGVVPNQESTKNETPILAAVGMGDGEMVDLLIKSGADMNTTRDGYPLLHYALVNGNVDVMKVLINNGISFDSKDSKNRSPLMLAIIMEDAEKIKILIENGANINEASNNTTPLFEAVQRNNPDITLFLLQNGADAEQRTPLGTKPLGYALTHNINYLATLLISHGADRNNPY